VLSFVPAKIKKVCRMRQNGQRGATMAPGNPKNRGAENRSCLFSKNSLLIQLDQSRLRALSWS
jgi:hypothetical protein